MGLLSAAREDDHLQRRLTRILLEPPSNRTNLLELWQKELIQQQNHNLAQSLDLLKNEELSQKVLLLLAKSPPTDLGGKFLVMAYIGLIIIAFVFMGSISILLPEPKDSLDTRDRLQKILDRK